MARRRNYFRFPNKRYFRKMTGNRAVYYVIAAIAALQVMQTYLWQILLLIALVLAGIWYYRHNKKKSLRVAGIHQIDRMEGGEFEDRIKLLFEDMGYSVKKTPVTGDFGADLIANKANERIIIQCKRYSSKVGLQAVQEAATAVTHYGAHRAMVITNNTFTSQARLLAKSNGVELVDRAKLIKALCATSGCKNPGYLSFVRK